MELSDCEYRAHKQEKPQRILSITSYGSEVTKGECATIVRIKALLCVCESLPTALLFYNHHSSFERQEVKLWDALVRLGLVVDSAKAWPVLLCLMLISDWQVSKKTAGYSCTEMLRAT